MSTGMIVDFGGRPIFLFDTSDNDSIISVLKERGTRTSNDNSGSVYMLLRYFILTILKAPKTDDPRDFNTHCLFQASQVYPIIKKYKDQTVALEEIKRACDLAIHTITHNKLDVNELGLNEFIARMVHFIRFEDPITTHDSFALWVEDFGNNHTCFD
jgi:hypothetical protein